MPHDRRSRRVLLAMLGLVGVAMSFGAGCAGRRTCERRPARCPNSHRPASCVPTRAGRLRGESPGPGGRGESGRIGRGLV